jgi:integrase
MLDEGKDPARGDGYAHSTATMRAYRLDKFYRDVWNAERRYTEDITTAHADAWLEHIDEQEYTESYKAACSKALVTLFEWKAAESNTSMTWEPTKRFSSTRARQPRDFFTEDERNRLREAALEFGSVPNYYEVPASDRSAWTAYLAQRFGKPKSEVTIDDWQRANSWKVPSLLWVTLDAGLRPIEVERAQVSWVDTENAVLRIPKEKSAKNHENWQTSLQQRTVLAVEKWLHERTLRPEYEETDALWLTKHGNPYGSQALNPLLRKVCDVAGIDLTNRDLTWYSICHSVGTYMTEERGLKAAATQLRHKTIRSTIKYDQAPLEARREALERMG